MAFHGKPRYTGDLDVFIRPTTENARRMLEALRSFGAPTGHVSEQELATRGMTLTLGTPPRRIDILNWLSGLDWTDAASDAQLGEFGPVKVRFLSLRPGELTSKPPPARGTMRTPNPSNRARCYNEP